MSYENEANAGYRHTGWAFGGTSFFGKIRLLIEKIVNREPLMADDNNSAQAMPVDELGARVTLEFLDNAGAIDESEDAANLVTTFSEANGSGSGGVTVGKLVPGSVTHTEGRKQGGFTVAQIMELEGDLTYTPTA